MNKKIFFGISAFIVVLLLIVGLTFYCFPFYDVSGTEIIYGDVNDDGNVNPLDSSIFARNLAGWEGYDILVNCVNSDVDLSGTVNPLDLSCLVRYLGVWEGYESLPYITATEEPTVAPTATPYPDPGLLVSSTSGEVGDQVEININLVNNPGVDSMRLRVDYASNLKLVSVQDSGLLGTYSHGTDLTANSYQLYWIGGASSSNNTNNGTIATLVFEILYGASGNDYNVSVSYNINNYDIYDIDLMPVLFNTEPGKVNVTGLSVTTPPTPTPSPMPTHISGLSDYLYTISPPTNDINIPQGGCFDGTYFYQVFIKKDIASNEANNLVRIVKYNTETRTVVRTSDNLSLNHANDITYNPKINALLVVNNNPNRTTVTLVNPDTLTIIRTQTVPYKIYSMSYNEQRDMYVVGISGGQNFRFLDADFNPVGTLKIATTLTSGYVTQGASSDNNYIYFVLYDQNVITVYDWEGNFVSIIDLNVGDIEPENISVVNGEIFVACASGGAEIYRIILN